ncbi:hypothetical protein [Streptomyces sp. NPDC047014]|uniref:hypothetical protein n=1 Tax=Streptomyces sp. NPDC047014 TaxID=3155736 RepID=UPI0033FBF56A
MPLPPVLVRSHVPGRRHVWVDPSPLVADSRGHAWTYSADDPFAPQYCTLCCEDCDSRSVLRPCPNAGLLRDVNERRDEWIAAHRVNPEDIR